MAPKITRGERAVLPCLPINTFLRRKNRYAIEHSLTVWFNVKGNSFWYVQQVLYEYFQQVGSR